MKNIRDVCGGRRTTEEYCKKKSLGFLIDRCRTVVMENCFLIENV